MTSTIPEAQLEAYVLAVLREQLPHEKPESFRIERRFKFQIGHNEFDEDGTLFWEAEGRADLIIFHNDRPLAVIELKRADKTISEATVKQARSYAAVLNPRPPLVIASNGRETWVRRTDDGQPLSEDLEGAGFVERLFENVARVAAADMSWAIEVLMGPETTVWVEAVRQRTDDLIERLTGGSAESSKPFARGLLFHRKATLEILEHLEAAAKAVIAEGAPLVGKSNVLRELAVRCRHSPDWAVLMVNGATKGAGLFQRLANVLGAALDWKLSADDVRNWLRRMSHSSRPPSLVLAIDGIRAGSDVERDVEELAEAGFGEGLRIVITTERTDEILQDASGRGETSLASIARDIEVRPLDNEEFQAIRESLLPQRILFFGGAELSLEYRSGWILRSVLSDGRAPAEDDQAAVIPAAMGLKVIQVARERLSRMHEVERLHRLVARDALADEKMPSAELSLSQAGAFIVRRDALSHEGEEAVAKLEALGWVSFTRHATGEDVVVFRAPEFVMSELASELARILGKVIDEPVEAATQLIWQCDRLYLGDLIGAQAMVDLARRNRSLPLNLLKILMNDQPQTESLAGKLVGFPTADGGTINLRFDDRGWVAHADEQGNPIEPFREQDWDEGDQVIYGNMTSWMILSQLARLRSVLGTGFENRFDIEIILHVGRCHIPLMRAGGWDQTGQVTQRLGSAGSVLALEQALAEPITAAMHKLFAEEWRELDVFFDRLEQAGSLPLTARVHHALAALRNSATPGLDHWATAKLKELRPLLRRQLDAARQRAEVS